MRAAAIALVSVTSGVVSLAACGGSNPPSQNPAAAPPPAVAPARSLHGPPGTPDQPPRRPRRLTTAGRLPEPSSPRGRPPTPGRRGRVASGRARPQRGGHQGDRLYPPGRGARLLRQRALHPSWGGQPRRPLDHRSNRKGDRCRSTPRVATSSSRRSATASSRS